MTQTLLMKCRSMILAALLVVALGGALLGGASQASAQMADPAETGDLSTTPGDGTLLAWGLNDHGQLGNGRLDYRERINQPMRVSGMADAKAVAAGTWHSLALRTDGTVWAWGYNNYT